MRIVNMAVSLENDDSLHMARLLMLLRSCGGRSGIKPVASIAKLARLDFLLRYPGCLTRALLAEEAKAELQDTPDYELGSIEARMVRYRYGPWDSRYRRLLYLMRARNLLTLTLVGKIVQISLTEAGTDVATRLADAPELAAVANRSQVVGKVFGGKSAAALSAFLLTTIPEILSFRVGEEIRL